MLDILEYIINIVDIDLGLVLDLWRLLVGRI